MQIISFIESVGYLGIAVLMFLETYLPIVQSEIVMSFGGYAAQRGELNLFLVILVGVIGSELGAISLYGLARKLKEETVLSWIEKYGFWLDLDKEKIEKGNGHFKNHQKLYVFLGRFIPGVRAAVAIPAGFQAMPLYQFAFFNLFGTLAWSAALAFAGYYLAEQYRLVSQYSSYVTYGLLAVFLLFVVFRGLKYYTHRNNT